MNINIIIKMNISININININYFCVNLLNSGIFDLKQVYNIIISLLHCLYENYYN